jgi:S1-C subfamily serine protease
MRPRYYRRWYRPNKAGATSMSTVRLHVALSILATSCFFPAFAAAQNLGASGRYGVVSLASNFRPDPHVVEVVAGGPDAASRVASGCSGFISNDRPDYELNYSNPGQFRLGFYVVGDTDTTLVINDPSGRWFCNDDFGDRGGVNPGVVFDNPAAGNYDIWVGAYERGGTGAEVDLFITETGAPWDPLFGSVALAADFRPDPHTVRINAGGADRADSLADGCVGYVNAVRPDYGVQYSGAGPYSLSMFAEGDEDSTLVVRDPSGRWFCNDDFSSAGGYNPGVVLGDPVDGFYSIWVGTYSEDGAGESVSLWITEAGAPWDGASAAGGAPSIGGDPTTLVASGTGFLVSGAGHVLTNHHVVEGCTRLTFQIRGDLAVEASLLSSNATTDLALLRTGLAPAVVARFRSGASVRLGDDVVVYGFPLLGDLSSQGNLTTGIVSALSGLNDDLSRLQMTAQIQPGNSGGPVMDRAGQIVGVVVETANDEYFRNERGATPQNVNFAIRDSLARSFLETNNVAIEFGSGDAGTTIADVAERAQDFTGIILCYQ